MSNHTACTALQGKELGKTEAASSFSDTALRGLLSAKPRASLPRAHRQSSEYTAPEESPPAGKAGGAATLDSEVCVKQTDLGTPERPRQRDSSSSPSECKGPASLSSHHSPRQEPNRTGIKQDTRGDTGKQQHVDYQEKRRSSMNST